MPELPEVEVVRQGLELLVGKKVERVSFVPGKVVRSDLNLLIDKEITKVERRGRYLKLAFGVADHLLIIHLGMTGKLQVSVGTHEGLVRHEFFRLSFDSREQLSFCDYRHFGKAFLQKDFSSWEDKIGLEPLSSSLTAGYWFKKARNKHLPLKLFLMDNQIVTGIGNIYANEILFAAKQHPERPAWTISLYEWDELVTISKEMLQFSIEHGGCSVKDYVNAEGKEGSFQNFLKVYGRKGQACLECGRVIKVVKLGGRSSFFCEGCQGF